MPVPDDALSLHQRWERDVRRAALARAIVAAREQAGMTQVQLAAASGISRSAIVRLEKAEASISSDRLWSLAKALGTKPSALLAAAEADEDAAETLD